MPMRKGTGVFRGSTNPQDLSGAARRGLGLGALMGIPALRVAGSRTSYGTKIHLDAGATPQRFVKDSAEVMANGGSALNGPLPVNARSTKLTSAALKQKNG